MPYSIFYHDISIQEDLVRGRIENDGTLPGEHKLMPGSILYYDISIKRDLCDVGCRVMVLSQEIAKVVQTGYSTITSAYKKTLLEIGYAR